jgi:hypothetical protein
VVSFTSLPLSPGVKAPGIHWLEGLVGPKADLNIQKRKFMTLPGPELQPIANRYTDYAIWDKIESGIRRKILEYHVMKVRHIYQQILIR